MSSKKLGDLIVDYQNKNCGGGQIDLTGRTRVELSENELSKKEITTVLHARGIDFSDDQSESQLLSALKNTSSGMNFTKAELLLFTKDRMSDILKNRGIDAPSSATKDKLTDNLFRGLQ